MNEVGVNLAERHQRPFASLLEGPNLAKKGSAILLHRPRRILTSEAEIQALSAIRRGNSPGPCAEAMDQPWDRRQRKGIGVENVALGSPEGFQRHRNILATYRLSVMRADHEIGPHGKSRSGPSVPAIVRV